MMMMKEVTVWLLLVSLSINTAAQETCSYYGDIRLAGGNESEGRVEVCIGGVWGTVCDESWDYRESQVVCRRLGFEERFAGSFNAARYGESTGPIYLGDLHCTGQESSLLDCSTGYEIGQINSWSFCSHSREVAVRCPTAPCIHDRIRLIGGMVPTEGRVEVCVRGRWTGVCDSEWNYQDAFVVCRQLGYPATGAVPYSGSSRLRYRLGRTVNGILTSFRCYGNETQLLGCIHSVGSCSRADTVGVHCYGDVVSALYCNDIGDVRLVGGADSNEGRVEVCRDRIWGTVCGDGWDSRDATVVCRQLGYQNPYGYPYINSSAFGAGSGPIFLNDLNCQGSEDSLLDCGTSSTPYSCSHISDAGVRCEHEIEMNSGCLHGTIQLAGGHATNEGRVEICINGVWGTVCDDSWNPTDARVACRQLRFPYTGAVSYSDAYFGSDSGHYHLDDVQCMGSESSLLICNHSAIGVHNCRPGNEAGVKCLVAPTCTHGNVRLVGGVTSFDGGVEICLSGSWTTVCDSDLYPWNVNESTVVCRQLTGEENPMNSAIHAASEYYERGSYHFPYVSRLSCSGSESQLLSCSYTPLYSPCSDRVGVQCYVNSNCTEGEVRLAGGESEMEGRVEVCHDQIWWAASRALWRDIRVATIICRHLHYPSDRVIPLLTAPFGRGNATILVSYFNCVSVGQSLENCARIDDYILPYYSSPRSDNRLEVASVICQSPPATTQPECSSGDLRLVGGERESEGRVEICVEGFWGTVCDCARCGREETFFEYRQLELCDREGCGRKEAFVVCRQLGMNTSGAFPAFFGEGSGLIHSGISCTGAESNVAECKIGQSVCQSLRSFGVTCQDRVYTVTVVTDPPSGPHFIGSTVNLTCLMYPQLPEAELTYHWRAIRFIPSPIVVGNSSLPYATFSIGVRHPRTSRYFCEVYYRNELLATGHTVITVQGLLYPIGPTSVHYTSEEMVVLQVNITSTQTVSRDYFRDLTWYYDGVEIVPTSDGTVSLSSDNTTLTIANASSSCSGVYKVQFAGLRVYPYNYFCERETLALLRHYPLLSPVTFYVYNSSGNPFEEEDSVRDNIRLTPYSESLSYTSADYAYINISWNLPITLRYLALSSWYFNGRQRLPADTVQSSLKLPTGITQSLAIHNPTPFHAGTYENILYLYSINYLRQIGCTVDYPRFLALNLHLAFLMIFDQRAVTFEYYEPAVVPAVVSLQASRPALRDNEDATLSCTAVGGYPPTSSISWIKNGRIISTTSTNQLTIRVAGSEPDPFGQYVCLVNNSVNATETLFLMKQKGDLVVELDLGTSEGCAALENNFIEMLEGGVADAIQEMCLCNISPYDLEESQATCSVNTNTLTFTTTVVYSSESGNLTASTLIQMLEDRATGTVIYIGSQTATVTRVCSPCVAVVPAVVSLQASRPALRDDEDATLSCTAVGGYPPTSSVSWIKNGRIIAMTRANQLTISVAGSDSDPFGQYVCLVNNSVTTTQTLFLMKQKGDLVVELDLGTSEGCAALDNNSIEILEAGIADAIQEMCLCNISPYDLEESQATCSVNTNTLTFTTTVVYSSESGNLTASTLIQMLEDRATGTVIYIGSQTATVTRVCSRACMQPVEPASDARVAAIVGACVGGLLLIAIITTAVISWVLALKRRKVRGKVQLGHGSAQHGKNDAVETEMK